MTGKTTDTPRTRYFRTFSGHRHPVQPREEIAFSEARELATYYEARYDDEERLIEFVKRLRSDDGSESKWGIMFTEVYQYFDEGNLQQRTLEIPGQDNQVWKFTKHQNSWSSYFDQLCDRWFGRSRPIDQQSLARLSLLVHEQFTELEAEVFEAAVGVPRDSEWVFKITSRILDRTRDIIEEIEPGTELNICAFTKGQRDELRLEGFDEPEPNLGGIVADWREQHPEAADLEPTTLLAERDLDQMGQRWAAAANIGSITSAPIRAINGDKLATAAILFLTTSQALNEQQICVANSIFRRLLQQIQNVVEAARVHEVSNQDSEWP